MLETGGKIVFKQQIRKKHRNFSNKKIFNLNGLTMIKINARLKEKLEANLFNNPNNNSTLN